MKKEWPTYYKYFLLGVFLLVLCLPLLQKKLTLFELKPLSGAIEAPVAPGFGWMDWMDGKYQSLKENQIKESIGFYPLLIRLYNQQQYFLYNDTHAQGVIVGKEDYLYERAYIEAYLGMDYLGEDIIQDKVRKLRRISDTLKTKNIELVVLLAPGKGTFYSNYFPDKYNSAPIKRNNYESYRDAFHSTGIHLLDFQNWFLSMKGRTPYPLFSKGGIHWSYYGEVLSGDSLIKYMQQLLPNYQIPSLEITKVISDGEIRERDNDIREGLNLLLNNFSEFNLAYPSFDLVVRTQDKNKEKANVLVVSDSFYWGLFNWGMSRDVFNNSDFWYYNEMIYPESYEQETRVQDIDMKARVESNQAVLLICTDGNLHKFAFGFIDQLYQQYFPE